MTAKAPSSLTFIDSMTNYSIGPVTTDQTCLLTAPFPPTKYLYFKKLVVMHLAIDTCITSDLLNLIIKQKLPTF